jgi:hypothetical protein
LAIPRVFISSTCYDLKHIRENLKYFVKTIGYEPVLSDDGDVYYDVDQHTHNACLAEVDTCQLFILIIGGRYGGEHKDREGSITNNEYRAAVKNKTPIFALVESAVHSDHYTYLTNKKSRPDIFDKIDYPSIDNIKIFDFVDEVRKNSQNNAIVPFNDFSDMETYLKKQWAGMMYDLLDKRRRDDSAKVTNRLIDDLAIATEKSAKLIETLLRVTDAEHAEEKISKIELQTQAQSFHSWLREYFDLDYLFHLDAYLHVDITQYDHWYEYLASIEGFSIVTTFDDSQSATETYIHYGSNKSYHSVLLSKKIDNKTITEQHFEIQKSFEALKQVEPKVRNDILKSLTLSL